MLKKVVNGDCRLLVKFCTSFVGTLLSVILLELKLEVVDQLYTHWSICTAVLVPMCLIHVSPQIYSSHMRESCRNLMLRINM